MKPLFIVILFSGYIMGSCTSETDAVSVEQFGIAPGLGTDASRAFRAAIDYCSRNNVKKLILPKGRYDFYPDNTCEKFMYISNNSDGIKSVAFLLDNMNGFEIDGQGSSFVFHGFICPFILENSSHISLKNFSIDFARTFHSEGLITNVGNNYIEVSFSEYYPCQIENERLKFYDREEKRSEYPFGYLLEYDLQKRETAFKVKDYFTGDNIRAEKTASGNVRLYINDITATAGNRMIFSPTARICPGITLNNCNDISFEDINIYHSGGMGIIAQLSSNITIDKTQCTLSPLWERAVSCTADATHFSNCTGTISITNSLFEHQMDDAVNVHGVFMRIEEISGPRSVILRLVHHEQLGLKLFAKDELLEFVDSKTVETYAHGTVQSVRQLNKDLTEIVFEENLPVTVQLHDVVGATVTPDVIFRNNIVRKNRARGILLGSRKQILVENNTFHTSGAAILTGGDTQYWFEQGGVSNMIIRNNLFDNCLYGVWESAVIQLDAGLAKGDFDRIRYNRNVIIEDNKFLTFDPRLLKATSVNGLVFRNNKIIESTDYLKQNEGSNPLVIDYSINVEADFPE
jgi:parallel beta-helix repeat protein